MKPKQARKALRLARAEAALRREELEREMEAEVLELHRIEMRVACLRARIDELDRSSDVLEKD